MIASGHAAGGIDEDGDGRFPAVGVGQPDLGRSLLPQILQPRGAVSRSLEPHMRATPGALEHDPASAIGTTGKTAFIDRKRSAISRQ